MTNKIIFNDSIIRNIEETSPLLASFLLEGKIAYTNDFQRIIGEYQGGGGGVIYIETYDPVSQGITVTIETTENINDSKIIALPANTCYYRFNDTIQDIPTETSITYQLSFKVCGDNNQINSNIKLANDISTDDKYYAFMSFSNSHREIKGLFPTCYSKSNEPATTANTWVNPLWKDIQITSNISPELQVWLDANGQFFTPNINKVVYNNKTLIDLTNDALDDPEELAQDVSAHTHSGAQIVGTGLSLVWEEG